MGIIDESINGVLSIERERILKGFSGQNNYNTIVHTLRSNMTNSNLQGVLCTMINILSAEIRGILDWDNIHLSLTGLDVQVRTDSIRTTVEGIYTQGRRLRGPFGISGAERASRGDLFYWSKQRTVLGLNPLPLVEAARYRVHKETFESLDWGFQVWFRL